MESNFYEWVGGSIDVVLNDYVQLMAQSVIGDFSVLLALGGALFFMTMGLLSVKSIAPVSSRAESGTSHQHSAPNYCKWR